MRSWRRLFKTPTHSRSAKEGGGNVNIKERETPVIRKILFVSTAVVALAGAAAHADFTEMYMGSVSFSSDAQAGQSIVLPSFDTMGGTRTLLSVQVDVLHRGSVQARGDNDDDFKEADVQARMIRQFALFGPGVAALGSKMVNGPTVHLGVDNGDDGMFDATGPDGTDFGMLSYAFENAFGSPFGPSPLLYATPGPNTVVFNVPGFNEPNSQLLMVNDQQFFGPAPDQWQLEVQNPLLEIKVAVTYNWIPEPMTLSLVGLGGLLLRRRMR